MTSTAFWAAGGWILATLTIANAWFARANWKRSLELDEFASELLRDRARVIEAARQNAEASASLGIFVQLNPLARLKSPSPEA